MLCLVDLQAAGATLAGDCAATTFSGIAYDSRMALPGELFVALRTARADGHEFIAHAVAAGVAGVLCAQPVDLPGVTVLYAADPTRVLQRWAQTRLRQVGPRVVAVTGSVGKTSTRQAIAAVLAERGPVFAGRRSYNSLLGLPVSLAGLSDDTRYAVLEFGADGFGEISQLAALFPPQVGVITAIDAAHLAAFGDLEGVAREKGDLLAALPGDGWAIVPGDSPLLELLRTRTTARVLTFGTGAQCDLRGQLCAQSLAGSTMRFCWQGQQRLVGVGLLGEPALTTALAAAGAGLACGLAFDEVCAALGRVEPVPGRLRPLPARTGATILDDTYSAAPPSIVAALHTLTALPARRRFAVLGAPEGDHRPAIAAGPFPQAHVADATIAAAARGIDMLIGIGDWGATLVERVLDMRPEQRAVAAPTAIAALEALPHNLRAGDIVLVKGGAHTRLERITAALLDSTVDAATALVRQEHGWHSVRSAAPGRPTWLQIDLDAISANVRRLRDIAGVPVMAVLKADAYGHGAVRAARAALVGGAAMLAVATLGEAAILRAAGISAPILVLGYTPPWQARDAVRLRVACTVFDDDAAQAYAAAASDLDSTLVVHVKVDTGMARLGLAPGQAGPFLRRLATMPRLVVEGLYTHFATADGADEAFAQRQLAQFTQLVGELEHAELRPAIVHAANSAALLRFPAARFDMVRPGIACYGLAPSADTPLPPGFAPALTFHTEVAQVREVPAGTPISYGGTFVTQRISRIATIPVGYADGLRRAPPWRAVLVRGRLAPIVGRICMDYAMVDVSDVAGVRRGDPVTLIGAQGGERITADDVAHWLGTISYEVLATILPRVPREVG